jgi:hypothetical protein
MSKAKIPESIFLRLFITISLQIDSARRRSFDKIAAPELSVYGLVIRRVFGASEDLIVVAQILGHLQVRF